MACAGAHTRLMKTIPHAEMKLARGCFVFLGASAISRLSHPLSGTTAIDLQIAPQKGEHSCLFMIDFGGRGQGFAIWTTVSCAQASLVV
jgi:hypothetical protein